MVKKIRRIQNRLMIVSSKIVGSMFLLGGLLVAVSTAFSRDHGFLGLLLGSLFCLIGALLLIAKKGIYSDSAKPTRLDELKSSLDRNEWGD